MGEPPDDTRGFRPSALLTLPDPERRMLQWLLRRDGETVEEIAAHFGLSLDFTRNLLEGLDRRGFLAVDRSGASPVFRHRLGGARNASR